MKKVFFLALAAAAALALVSCNKEIDSGDRQEVIDPDCPEGCYVEVLDVSFPASLTTRTAFNEETGRFAWSEGDELAFHLSNGEYISAPIDPATGKVKLYLPIGVERNNYAVYPASAAVEGAAAIGNMQVTLPDAYDISGNLVSDFVATPLVATNEAGNRHLKFEHVGALLQVSLDVPAGVKTARVSMGRRITGSFTLTDGSGNGIIAPGDASVEDGVTFTLSEEGLAELTQAKLLVPLPSGSYDSFRLAYDNGFVFSKDLSDSPWNLSRSGGKKVTISEENFEDMRELDVFWIEALEAGSTVAVNTTSPNDVKLYYSVNDNIGSSFVEWDCSPVTLENVGDRIYIYGENDKSLSVQGYSTGNYVTTFTGTGKWKAGGPLFALNVKDWTTNDALYTYARLFYKNEALVDASEIVMPVSSRSWYNSGKPSTSDVREMFYQCVNLVAAPGLPAESGSSYCYKSLFAGCTSLKDVPELGMTATPYRCFEAMFASSGITSTPEFHFTTVGQMSCFDMFSNCKSLATIENLPFTKVGDRGCESMFSGCTALTETPDIIVTQLSSQCMRSMFYGCSSLRKTTAILPASTLASGCYSDMYMNTALTECPELPATVMQPSCYQWMFCGCKSLTKVCALPATQLASYCYDGMFLQCTSLKQVPEDLLPATVMQPYCYYRLFSECKSLTNAPALPSTQLAKGCYKEMFNYTGNLRSVSVDLLPATQMFDECYMKMFCESGVQVAPDLPSTQLAVSCYQQMYWKSRVTNCPDLPATQLYERCYSSMFYDSSVSSAPEVLPAMQLAEYCYNGMFEYCRGLKVAPRLPATDLVKNCYSEMFYGSGVTACPELPATVMAESCYSGMFCGCLGLTAVPVLPAMALAKNCYSGMFKRSENIEGGVVLPSTELIDGCYNEMFVNCAKLESADIKATSADFNSAMKYMFSGCSNLNKVTVAFAAWPTYGTTSYDTSGSTQPTNAWFSSGYLQGYSSPQNYEVGVAEQGSFYWTRKPASAEIVFGASFIPTGWTVYAPESIGAN